MLTPLRVLVSQGMAASTAVWFDIGDDVDVDDDDVVVVIVAVLLLLLLLFTSVKNDNPRAFFTV
jgi:hypothetical protein